MVDRRLGAAMAMTNSFRIDATELEAWRASLAARADVRGVPAIAKEIEAALAKREPDGTVILSRHQLFTWSQALEGAASRGGPDIARVGAQIQDILRGRVTAPAAPPSPPPTSTPTVSYATPSPIAYQPPPPVQYGAPAVAYGAPPVQYGVASSASPRIVAGRELAELARDLVRGARSDLLISSPWDTGVETLVNDITALPPQVRVMIVSRRPMQDSAPFHQAMDALGRRRAITAFSPMIQTRLIVQDNDRALVGAASVPPAVSREAAVLLTDRASVAAVRAHFERVHAEAAGGPGPSTWG